MWWVVFDLGWVVGYFYICYGFFFYGNIIVLYEGKFVGILDVGVYFCVFVEYGVVVLFIVLIVIRVIC